MIKTNRQKCFCLWIACSLFIAGCTVDRVKPDLVEYVNRDILGISELEVKAHEKYEAVTGKNFTTNTALYSALKNEVIPTYGRFLYLLRKIEPETNEVKQLHSILVQGAEKIHNGFKIKMIGLEKEDEQIIQAADKTIRKGMLKTIKWRGQLAVLYQKHDVGGEKKRKWLPFLNR